MPRRDGTGPQGMGPMTGKKAGRCGRKITGSTEKNSVLYENKSPSEKIRGFFHNSLKNNKKLTGRGRSKNNT